MNIINAENLTKSYTERKLLDKASFYLQEGEKVGVIGINGTGKSTLLKIIAGLEEPDEGQVTCANHIVVRYLPQNPVFDPEMTVLDSVLTQCVLNFVGSGRTERIDADAHAQEQKWSLESDAKSMMTRLGITDFTQKTGELSGGQRKRLALVAALLVPCDVLILDEPTNHLDSAMADWLENFLKKWRGALVMITHDRYFLDSVCNRIVEVDKGTIYSYETNYSGYLERKAEREESAEASERKRQSVLRKELEWVRRGAKARTTKQKGRLQRYEELKNQKAPERDSQVEMSSVYSRMGKTTIELDHITKGYDGRTLLRDFSYIFLKGDRIGFIGANGSGKTTLMKMIAGRIKPDAGTITVGATIKIGYYTQEIETGREAGIAYMDPEEKVIDYIRNTAEYVRTTDGLVSASNMLERFLFPAAQQYSPIGKLSGGERRRLNLLRVLMEAPNVLILDEPTSSLDDHEVEKLFVLMRQLKEKGVAIVFVTHFLEQVYAVCDRITVLRNGMLVGEYPIEELPRVKLVAAMMGKDFDDLAAVKSEEKKDYTNVPVVIDAQGMSHKGKIKPFDLQIHKGEVVGLTGLLGSGRSELARVIYGADKNQTGKLFVNGKEAKINAPIDAMNLGMGLLPDDRKAEGIIADLSVRENIILAMQAKRGMFKLLPMSRQNEIADKYIELLQIKTASRETLIGQLSGGNQQKVILARWLATDPEFLILDEPTRGIDVGTKTEIQKLVIELADQGKSLIFISSEIEEMLRTCSKLVVLRDGQEVGEITEELTQGHVMQSIAGGGRNE